MLKERVVTWSRILLRKATSARSGVGVLVEITPR
jgi:hypothetical protein